MIELRVSVVFLLLFAGFLPFTISCVKAQGQEFVRMYMINLLTGNETFNVHDYPVNSVFTVDFYIGNITNLIAWQIHLSYNRSLICYIKAWFPEEDVFKEAVDKGATPLMEISDNVDNATDVGDLLIVMTSTYPPGSSLQYSVSVASKALLCKVNFTIVSHPAYTQLDFIGTPSQNPHGLHVVPPYHLPDYSTSVETLNGIYPAGGDPAVIRETDPVVPESPTLMVPSIVLLAILTVILTRRRRASSQHSAGSCQTGASPVRGSYCSQETRDTNSDRECHTRISMMCLLLHFLWRLLSAREQRFR